MQDFFFENRVLRMVEWEPNKAKNAWSVYGLAVSTRCRGVDQLTIRCSVQKFLIRGLFKFKIKKNQKIYNLMREYS